MDLLGVDVGRAISWINNIKVGEAVRDVEIRGVSLVSKVDLSARCRDRRCVGWLIKSTIKMKSRISKKNVEIGGALAGLACWRKSIPVRIQK